MVSAVFAKLETTQKIHKSTSLNSGVSNEGSLVIDDDFNEKSAHIHKLPNNMASMMGQRNNEQHLLHF